MSFAIQELKQLIAAGKRSLLRLLFCAAPILMLLGCGKSAEQTLRIAIIPWPGYESLHLAESLGYFDKSRIRLIEMTNSSQSSQALRNGTLDAALLTLDEMLTLMQDGVDLRVVLVMDSSNGADAVVARSDIASLQDLRGKRVAVETTAVGALMMDSILIKTGMRATDLQLVQMSVNEHVEAYQKGSIDAVVTFEPSLSKLLAMGGHVLFDSRSIPGRIIDVLAVRSEALTDHPQELAALVAAHFKALAYFKNNPQDAAARIAPFLDVRADQVLQQFTGLLLPDLPENRALLSGATPRLSLTASQLVGLMFRHRLLHSSVPVNNLVYAGFLPSSSN